MSNGRETHESGTAVNTTFFLVILFCSSFRKTLLDALSMHCCDLAVGLTEILLSSELCKIVDIRVVLLKRCILHVTRAHSSLTGQCVLNAYNMDVQEWPLERFSAR